MLKNKAVVYVIEGKFRFLRIEGINIRVRGENAKFGKITTIINGKSDKE